MTEQNRPTAKAYTVFADGFDEFEIRATQDIKAVYWEAVKCHFGCFEVTDTEGRKHTFATAKIVCIFVGV